MSALHWHVATGLRGYGPDAADSDGFPTFDDVVAAADYAAEEIRRDDRLSDVAAGHAEAGDFEAAWHSVKLIESLDITARNISSDRMSAPLYGGDRAKWTETVRTLVDETFPLDLDVAGNVGLYVWHCTNDECVVPADVEVNGDDLVETARALWRVSEVPSLQVTAYNNALTALVARALEVSDGRALEIIRGE